jgi:hypothetical protein
VDDIFAFLVASVGASLAAGLSNRLQRWRADRAAKEFDVLRASAIKEMATTLHGSELTDAQLNALVDHLEANPQLSEASDNELLDSIVEFLDLLALEPIPETDRVRLVDEARVLTKRPSRSFHPAIANSIAGAAVGVTLLFSILNYQKTPPPDCLAYVQVVSELPQTLDRQQLTALFENPEAQVSLSTWEKACLSGPGSPTTAELVDQITAKDTTSTSTSPPTTTTTAAP